jgi:hypothetical protein
VTGKLLLVEPVLDRAEVSAFVQACGEAADERREPLVGRGSEC